MAIYKYTLIKYLKSWSTWIIAGVTFLLIFFLAGFIAFTNFKPDDANAPRKYAILVVSLVSGITSFLAIFTSVFAGFKSASMFKDEVEDGTFLVMLSKPITRSKLILFKWLSLLTILVGYTFLVALSFLLTVIVFDKGYLVSNLNFGGVKLSTLRSSIFLVSIIMWGILTVVALIFSSIALLLSTKLSVGTTIGVSIALGVIIPITSLVSIFTKKPEYKSITNSNAASLKEILKNFDIKDNDIVNITDDPETLYSVGISTGDEDTYTKAFVGDLNFQIGVLASYASDRAIPKEARDFAAQTYAGNGGTPGLSSGSFVKANEQGYFQNVNGDDKYTQLKAQFDKALKATWEKSYDIRAKLLLISSVSVSMLKPKTTLKPGFINLSNVFNFYDKTTGDVKNLIDQSKGDPAVFWESLVKFVQREVITIQPTIGNLSINQIKHSLDLLSLISEVESSVAKNKFSFDVVNREKLTGVLTLYGLNLKADEFAKNYLLVGNTDKVNIQTLLYPMQYLSWLSNPLGVISTSTVNSTFSDSKLKMSDNAKYAPKAVDAKSVVDQETAAQFLLSSNKTTANTYREIMILLDNGYTIKRIKYQAYVNRQWLLLVYIAIALALVPLTYLSIRKQDYR